MRIVLAADGTRGDLQPLIELGARLRAAGHDALVCGPPDFAAQALARGVAFRSLGPSVRDFLIARADRLGRNPMSLITEAIRHIRQQITARLADLIEITRGADLVVARRSRVRGLERGGTQSVSRIATWRIARRCFRRATTRRSSCRGRASRAGRTARSGRW